jgi:hypothetical protein
MRFVGCYSHRVPNHVLSLARESLLLQIRVSGMASSRVHILKSWEIHACTIVRLVFILVDELAIDQFSEIKWSEHGFCITNSLKMILQGSDSGVTSTYVKIDQCRCIVENMISSVSSAQPKLPANFFDLPTRMRLRAAKQVNQLWFVYMCQGNGFWTLVPGDLSNHWSTTDLARSLPFWVLNFVGDVFFRCAGGTVSQWVWVQAERDVQLPGQEAAAPVRTHGNCKIGTSIWSSPWHSKNFGSPYRPE